jgi:hypothetical protein
LLFVSAVFIVISKLDASSRISQKMEFATLLLLLLSECWFWHWYRQFLPLVLTYHLGGFFGMKSLLAGSGLVRVEVAEVNHVSYPCFSCRMA